MDDQSRAADAVDAVEDSAEVTNVLDSATLARLLEEVRNSDAAPQPTAYNRMHNRHNRS